MRERLTAAFVVLTIVVLVAAGIVRSVVLKDLVREQEYGHLRQEAELVAAIVTDREAGGGAVDQDFLQRLVDRTTRLEYDGGGRVLAVRGADYSGDGVPADDLSSTRAVPGGTITVSESDAVVRDLVGRDLGSLVALLLLMAVVAGIAGFVIASFLSAPFQRLAKAAGHLGRGRFDVELPRSSIPEARAIATALRTSAMQLEDRVHRERDFAEHASHVLKTPLTGLRLELEDLTLRDDVPADVRATASRNLAAVEQVSAVASELVELSRRGSLVAGSELTLVDLATQLAQRWSDRLGPRNRSLTAAAEGNLALTYTPGPVEHVTDLLLADVVRRSAGGVRLVFHGEEGGHLRIHVEAEGPAEDGAAERAADRSGDRSGDHAVDGDHLDRVAQARTVVEALGGVVTGDTPAAGVDVLLPRR
jgi:signal transduction histidine kinase